jgi:secondary thiamine-phosphate synthase enzyme
MIISVKSSKKTEMIDITADVERIIFDSKIREGLLMIFVPHTTAGIIINENADPTVKDDILTTLNKIVPADGNYRHMEGNSAAHIKSSLVGSSELIAIKDGHVVLGTWQGIFFCEFDGPRLRKVHVNILEGKIK